MAGGSETSRESERGTDPSGDPAAAAPGLARRGGGLPQQPAAGWPHFASLVERRADGAATATAAALAGRAGDAAAFGARTRFTGAGDAARFAGEGARFAGDAGRCAGDAARFAGVAARFAGVAARFAGVAERFGAAFGLAGDAGDAAASAAGTAFLLDLGAAAGLARAGEAFTLARAAAARERRGAVHGGQRA